MQSHASSSSSTNSIVPRRWLPAHRRLQLLLSLLCRFQRSHSSTNQHSSGKQEFLGGGTETMEQSTHNTATTRHWTWAFKRLLKTFLFSETAAHWWLLFYSALGINILTHSLTHSHGRSRGEGANFSSNHAFVMVFLTMWPQTLTFLPRDQCMPMSCHGVYVYKVWCW